MATASSSSTSTVISKTQLPPQIVAEFEPMTREQQAAIDTFYNSHFLPRQRAGAVTIKPDGTAAPPATVPWPKSLATLSEGDQRIFCYKLMVARKFDPTAAAAMLDRICQYRYEMHTDDRMYVPPAVALRGFDLTAFARFTGQQVFLADSAAAETAAQQDEIHKLYRFMKNEYWPCYHKTDRWGHPVLIETIGAIKPSTTLKKLKQLTKPGEPMTQTLYRYHGYVNEMGLRLQAFCDATIGQPEGRRTDTV